MIPKFEQFHERCLRASSSQGTWLAYRSAIQEFDKWTPAEDLIKTCKGRNKAQIYKVLDNYIGHLVQKGGAPNTIDRKFNAVKTYLRYMDVEIQNDTVKNKVKFPRRRVMNADRAPEIEELWEMISKADLRGKTMITMLASSGMRLGEMTALTLNDLDMRESPTRINIRAETAKERQARETYISDEATGYLKQWLNGRSEGYVFPGYRTNGDSKFTRAKGHTYILDYTKPLHSTTARYIITGTMRRTGLNKRGPKRYEIHPHVLRKLFLTQAQSIIGEAYAHALIGHRRYMDQYLSLSSARRAEIYLQAMPAVTIMSHVRDISRMRKQVEATNTTITTYETRIHELETSNKDLTAKVDQLNKDELIKTLIGRNEEMTQRMQGYDSQIKQLSNLWQEAISKVEEKAKKLQD